MSSTTRPSIHSFLARLVAVLALCACGATAAGLAWADAADVHISPPRDMRYPGTIQLAVDASDTAQGIFRVHEVVPVRHGELTLLYPMWIPGNHSPSGPIAMLAGLTITANGRRLEWMRDEYDVYAFHVDVPRDVSSLDVDFQYLSGRSGVQRIQMTDKMLSLEWNDVSLYPAGYYSRDITFAPSVTLPHGWQFGTALDTLSRSGDTTTFQPVTYNTLIDSPMYAGLYFERVDLDPGAAVPVHLDVVADAPKYLEMTPEQLQVHRNLVTQTYRLFGSHHYNHYDFLFSLSDQLTGNGLEHHRSSEDGTRANYFTDWDKMAPRTRPPGARVQPLLERQVPPPGRSVDAQPQRTHGRLADVGLRGPDPVLGLRDDRALRHVEQRAVPRSAGDGGGQLRPQPARLRVADHRGHDQRPHRGASAAAALPQLADE